MSNGSIRFLTLHLSTSSTSTMDFHTQEFDNSDDDVEIPLIEVNDDEYWDIQFEPVKTLIRQDALSVTQWKEFLEYLY